MILLLNDVELSVFPTNLMLFNNKSLDQLETFIWQRLLLSNDGDLFEHPQKEWFRFFSFFPLALFLSLLYFCVCWCAMSIILAR